MSLSQRFHLLFKFIIFVLAGYFLISAIFVAVTLVTAFDISPSLKKYLFTATQRHQGQEHINSKVIAIISPTNLGESQQAIMLKQAAENLGHQAYIFVINNDVVEVFRPAKFIYEKLVLLLNHFLKPDFYFSISFHVNIKVPDPKIMYISVPEKFFEGEKRYSYDSMKDYNNFIDINMINGKQNWLSGYVGKKVNSHPGVVGIPRSNYKKAKDRKLLFYGSLWGRKSIDISYMLKKLAENHEIYFTKPQFSFFLDLSYNNDEVVDVANNLPSLLERLNEYGIGLCLHSKYHNEFSIPSSRIFEIISSGAIAISDKNKFITKNFGDSVLYIDVNKSGEELYRQIKTHLDWIKNNPAIAEKKARKAHQILQRKFTTELFLQYVIDSYLGGGRKNAQNHKNEN